MEDKTNLKKIEEDKQLNIKKTMDYPISGALRWWELKDTISQEKKTNILAPNQISVSLDKYENRIIKKRKVNL